MFVSKAFVGLTMAAAATAQSVTSVWLPNLALFDFPVTVQGSIVSSNKDATTVAIQCPARFQTTFYCSILDVMTVTWGPSTLGYNYDQYRDNGNGISTLRISESYDCALRSSTAVCANAFTEQGGEGPVFTDTGTLTFTNYATYGNWPLTVAIAAPTTATKTETALTTSSDQADTGASSTLAITTPSAAWPRPDSTSVIANTTSHFTPSASPTKPENVTNLQATPLVVTGSGTYSMSTPFSNMVGMAAIVGAIVMLF
ncbi:hypothetical protein AK830_g2892 [Neonectria ditissima]|uniref:Ig-like domain-containing protein n=1 Tax=Neonectria ditissima TaxID=78410 RepID=A0A0P7BSM1_9HYPO|nr:hypothetical protein AK830_g2892 [Neonectria ditissima]